MGSGKARGMSIKIDLARCNWCGGQVVLMQEPGGGMSLSERHSCPGNVRVDRTAEFTEFDLARLGMRVTRRRKRYR